MGMATQTSACLTVLIAFSAWPHVTLAGQRRSMAASANPASSVGMVLSTEDVQISTQDGGSKFIPNAEIGGTGFLISPCLVMTAYHVVFGNTRRVPTGNERAIFKVASQDVVAKPVAYGGYRDLKHSLYLEDDWAILRLDQCIGNQRSVGWLQVHPTTLTRSTPSYYVGFQQENSKHARNRCTIYPILASSFYFTNCLALPGMSGGPFFSERENLVVGIVYSKIDPIRIPKALTSIAPRTALCSMAAIDRSIRKKYGFSLIDYIRTDRLNKGNSR